MKPIEAGSGVAVANSPLTLMPPEKKPDQLTAIIDPIDCRASDSESRRSGGNRWKAEILSSSRVSRPMNSSLWLVARRRAPCAHSRSFGKRRRFNQGHGISARCGLRAGGARRTPVDRQHVD